jgi:hypothetical protein
MFNINTVETTTTTYATIMSIMHYLKQISWKKSINYSAVSLWNSLPKVAKVNDVSIRQLNNSLELIITIGRNVWTEEPN